MRRIWILVTALLVACGPATEPAISEAPGSGLTFIHLNDIYRVGAVEDGTAGGFGRIVTLTRELQSQGRDVRVLFGGDFLYPSLESQLWAGMQMVEAMNFIDGIAPMYVVAGNHEFDPRTPDHLVDAVRASRFDWLGDNYRFNTGVEEVDQALRTSFMFEAAGHQVGVFALLLHAKDDGNDRDYAPTDPDYLGHAKRVIETLEDAGADLIIGLTHLHMWTDVEIARLRAEHPRFMFIVGGHEHEPEHSPLRADSAEVMKGASNARQVWRIDVEFDAAGMPSTTTQLVDIDTSIMSDPEYDEIDQKWRGKLLDRFPFLTARVGEAAVPLDAREVTIRNEESNWGNFVVDQMRGAFGEPQADLAFINSGTLRIDDFIIGDVVFEDIGRTFGFSSYLRHMMLTGAEFREVMEAGFRGEGPSKGYFPQVSGFRICVDRSRPEGERIVSLQLPGSDSWAEIRAEHEYTAVVPDFLYRGGDGYQIPQDQPVSRPGSELVYLVLDAVITAQAEGRKIGAPVDPNNPRIVILASPTEPCWPPAAGVGPVQLLGSDPRKRLIWLHIFGRSLT
jgi:2',3'-cyclic-nucleotide 2'-phosphodiesterase (5'-nucleotidase family)